MTDQADSGTTAAETAARPTTYDEASDHRTWDIVKAQKRYGELTAREMDARARAAVEARGEFDPVKHEVFAEAEPLTTSEHLELLANGEVLARYYRHPTALDHAAQAGATWEQIGAARGQSARDARQEYREWAEGQHRLWGRYEGRFGLDEAAYAAAMERAAEPEIEPEAG